MRLEPDAGKLARPVLRGGDGSNVVSLPDLDGAVEKKKPSPKFTLRVKCGDVYDFQLSGDAAIDSIDLAIQWFGQNHAASAP